ncbi:unnamed protein product [Cyclocybe aegerita]|uniref:Indole-diterpene biosynthesis protein PaxU n=1 Tax=Cyclocybe aegerita TaxID=1973307 RepID=A0A8S0WPH0_CYCAE|nr:unnamed protein product [Cyclocybe aegerita]
MGQPSTYSGIIPIGKGIYLSKPKSDVDVESKVAAPTVILLFGWMGARLPHLLKYIKVYDELYPQATKIVIRSEASFFWTIKRRKSAYLAPVVEALEALGCLPPLKSSSVLVRKAAIDSALPPPKPRVLVHTFSNGGSWQLATLSDILADRASSYTHAPLPASALIFDSCPGRAFTGAIRNPLVAATARTLIWLVYLYLSFRQLFLRGPSTIDNMKARLNKEKLLPWFGRRTRRLYVYSTGDEIIPAKEVDRHAEKAREAGLMVTQVRFKDSPHVAHAKVHPEEYWGAVRKMWEEAVEEAELDTGVSGQVKG